MAVERLWEQEDCYFEKDGVARIFTLNRPESMNAYTQNITDGLARAVDEVKDDLSVGALIITGAGTRAFCAGPDNRPQQSGRPQPMRGGYEDFQAVRARHRRWAILTQMLVPTIAAVNGWAIGAGLDMAMACDILVASENAKFGYFYVKRGMVTDMGGAWYLPRAIGYHRAAEMLLTGDAWDAHEAHLMGLVGKVVPPDELIPTAVAMAERIAECQPKAVRMVKDLMYKSMDLDFEHWMDYLVLPQVTQDSDEEMVAWRAAYDTGGFKKTSRYMHEGPKL